MERELYCFPRALSRIGWQQRFLSRLPRLRAQIVIQLGLTAADLAGETMTKRTAGLSNELGRRLVIVDAGVRLP